MTCECGQKMKCTFTVPKGNIRLRVYKCKFCQEDFKTVETPVGLANTNVKRVVRELEGRRFLFYKTLRAGG